MLTERRSSSRKNTQTDQIEVTGEQSESRKFCVLSINKQVPSATDVTGERNKP